MHNLLSRLRAGDDDAAQQLTNHLFKVMSTQVDEDAKQEPRKRRLSRLYGELGVLYLAADTVVSRLRVNTVKDAESHALRELERLTADLADEQSPHIKAPASTKSRHRDDPSFVKKIKRKRLDVDTLADDPDNENSVPKGPRSAKNSRPFSTDLAGECYTPSALAYDAENGEDHPPELDLLPDDLIRTDDELHVWNAIEANCKGRRDIAEYTGLTQSVVRGCLERIERRIIEHRENQRGR